MGLFLQHLHQSVRFLLRNRRFAVGVILTLALGIGANTAIFSVVDGVLLRPAPVKGLERLVMVWETDRHSGTTREPASVPDYLDFVERATTVEMLSAFMAGEMNMVPPAGDPVRLVALSVTHQFLPMLGIQPILGRVFTDQDDRPHGGNVVLISESLWTRAFGRESAILGRAVTLDEKPYTIVGVVPDVADFGVLQVLSSAAYSRSYADRGSRTAVDVWSPLQPDSQSLPRDTHPIFVSGRLGTAASPAAAEQELGSIAADLEKAYPSNDGRGVFVEPLSDIVFGPSRPALIVLLVAVALLLLVACVNVANLLLARGATRAREVAARIALGAGWGKLMSQFLVESLLLTLASALAGIALAFVALQAFLVIAPADVPRLSEVTIDLRVLAATLIVSTLTAIGFSLVPIFQARRIDLQGCLRGTAGWHMSAGPERGRLRRMLVISELALAVTLVLGAGLLIKSFWRLQQVDPGFRPAGVLKAEYQLPPGRYPVNFSVWPNFKEMHAFTDALLRRVAVLPGVESAAVAGNHPLDPGYTNSFSVVGRETESRNWPEISVRRITPGYFRTVGLPLRRGRLLTEFDGTQAPPVLLVNEAAAQRFFPDQDPLGAKITFWGSARTIVGVIGNERFHGLTADEPLAVYLPLAQAPSANGAGVLLARTSGPPLLLSRAVQAAIREVDPGLAVFGIEPLEQTISRSLSLQRFAMTLLLLFAGLAIVLATIGIHGVLSYSVAQRTHELGIRIALGARPFELLRLVIGQGLLLVVAGVSIGLLGAAALGQLLKTLLFGISPLDAATFVLTAAVSTLVALAACYAPARRAARVDVTVALRSE
jgi:putative ABC transport system permease protein